MPNLEDLLGLGQGRSGAEGTATYKQTKVGRNTSECRLEPKVL